MRPHSLVLQDRGTALLAKCWNGCASKDIRAELKRRKLYTPGKANAAKPETAAEHKVARVYGPGWQANYMLILEGRQGTRKSTSCRILGAPWFFDNLPGDLATRDAALHLRGHWLVEISALHAFSRSQIDALEAFLTRQSDIYRPIYGRKDVHEPRQSMFIGTCNMRVYMTDPTGSRRFWPG
jgi:predicted P-loop ATPase